VAHINLRTILNDAFDCYSFGNGREFKIQDTLTGKSFTLGSNLENKDGYKRINRYADITYSGVFNLVQM
jgi:hypothetical protein